MINEVESVKYIINLFINLKFISLLKIKNKNISEFSLYFLNTFYIIISS